MAKKKVMQDQSQQEFYVGVNDPKSLRIDLLEASKQLIIVQQNYHTLQQLRKDKLALSKQLEEDVKELKKRVSQLKKIMPQAATPPKAKTKASVKKVQKQPEVKKPRVDELSKLQQELDALEQKLQNT